MARPGKVPGGRSAWKVWRVPARMTHSALRLKAILTGIMLSEINQTERQILYGISSTWRLRYNRLVNTKKKKEADSKDT